ncbi:SET domain-containing protein [Cryptosporidium felis]|nr:SET domain-containing protein [Cryptosporidium felis]
MSNCTQSECAVYDSYQILLNEISFLSKQEHLIEVYYSNKKGKHVHSKVNISKNIDILREVPFVSWPIKLMFGSSENIVFCENCLKVRNSNNKTEFLTFSTLGFEENICSKNCFKKISGISYEQFEFDSTSIKNGWGFYLNGSKGLSVLRNYQKSVDPSGNIPITAEAISRCIAQIAADIHFFWSELGKKDGDLQTALKLGIRTIENFVAPQNTLFPEINFQSLSECIQSVLNEPILRTFHDPQIVDILISRKTIEQLVGQLTLNSQGLSVLGDFYLLNKPNSKNEFATEMLKGACICVIQSCFNHSCDPNCYVHSQYDNTVIITTNRDIAEGEELTISYIDNKLPLNIRRELIQNYNFICDCAACKNEDNK